MEQVCWLLSTLSQSCSRYNSSTAAPRAELLCVLRERSCFMCSSGAASAVACICFHKYTAPRAPAELLSVLRLREGGATCVPVKLLSVFPENSTVLQLYLFSESHMLHMLCSVSLALCTVDKLFAYRLQEYGRPKEGLPAGYIFRPSIVPVISLL